MFLRPLNLISFELLNLVRESDNETTGPEWVRSKKSFFFSFQLKNTKTNMTRTTEMAVEEYFLTCRSRWYSGRYLACKVSCDTRQCHSGMLVLGSPRDRRKRSPQPWTRSLRCDKAGGRSSPPGCIVGLNSEAMWSLDMLVSSINSTLHHTTKNLWGQLTFPADGAGAGVVGQRGEDAGGSVGARTTPAGIFGDSHFTKGLGEANGAGALELGTPLCRHQDVACSPVLALLASGIARVFVLAVLAHKICRTTAS